METLIGLLGLAVLIFVLGGSAVAWYSFSKIRQAEQRVNELTKAVLHLKSLIAKLEPREKALSVEEDNSQTIAQSQKTPQSNVTPSEPASTEDTSTRSNTAIPHKVEPPKVSFTKRLEQFLENNGLLWIGAAILALGGVFLAKYSIEADLISIEVRLALGVAFAAALVIFAEYLYRKKDNKSNMLNTCAAIASGGVITGFALVLVTFSYYHFISPVVAFLSLALIAMLATTLALRYGPLLAAIGIVGAYAVPALVSTGSNNVIALLMYVNFVSTAAIWVAQRVNRSWLWWQSFLGHFIWVLISIFAGTDSDIFIIGLSLLLAQYLYVLSSVLGWQLKQTNSQSMSLKLLLMPRKEQLSIVLSLLLLFAFYIIHGFGASLILISVLLSAICLVLPIRHSAFDSWPYLALIFAWFVIYNYPIPVELDDPMLIFTGSFLFTELVAIVYFVYALVMIKHYPERPSFALFCATAPFSILALSYVFAPQQIDGVLFPVWSVILMVMAAICLWFTKRALPTITKVALWVLANTHLALVLTMWLNASTLTLALCAQLLLLAYYQQKTQADIPPWLTKLGLSIVLLRVTVSPWTSLYQDEHVFGLHWSLVVLPLVIIMVFFTRRLHENLPLRTWLEGALLHLVALFVTLETSYFLVGGYPDFSNLSFAEMAVLSMNWLILAVVYWWRYKLCARAYYMYAGSALALVAMLINLVINTHHNPFLTQINIGNYFILNWLMVIWGVPALIIGFALKRSLVPQVLNINGKVLWGLASVFAILFINGTVRSFFHDAQIWLELVTSQAEIYTYSIVWLIIAAGLILLGLRRFVNELYHAGFAILLLVVLKAFLFDMAHLDGLYRAISFIGLGLSLVGLGWLFAQFRSGGERVSK